jgi:hypothetical protein
MKKIYLLLSLVIILASCDKREVELKVDPLLTSESGIVGMIYDGNTSCDELEGSFVASTGKIDFVNGSFVFEQGSDWPFGLEVTVSEDGRYISFTLPASSQYCVGAVIAKGGNASNVFTYNPGVKGDEGLSSPINSSGNPAQLSNLTFCFVECEQPDLVIELKTQTTGDPAWTVVDGFTAKTVDYYSFVTGNVGKIFLNGDLSLPVGNIIVADTDADGLLEVTVDNSDMPLLNFNHGSHLFVGTLEQYMTLITPYEFPYQKVIYTASPTLTFDLPF